VQSRALTSIGQTGVFLPRLGVGTATLGDVFGPVPEGAAEELLATATANGLTYVDTAPLYGNGLSERRLGAALRALGDPDLTISTKVGRVLDASEPEGWRFDFSREGILRSLESSLERLGRDHVDILYVHDPDNFEEQLYRETWPTLERLRSEGVVRAIGLGMNQWELPLRLVKRVPVDLVMLAGRYTLLDQSGASEFLPTCLEHGVGVIAAGVFNSGVLIDPEDGAWYDYEPAPSTVLQRARRIREVLAAFRVSLPHAAVQFAASGPAVVSTVVGVASSETLAANIRALDTPLPKGLWEILREERLIA